MKRVIFGFLALSGLCAQAAAQTGRPSVATTPAAQTTATNAVQAANYHKFGPIARHFMLDWKDCQAAAQTAQSTTKKAAQDAAKAAADIQFAKLQDHFGVQLLPATHAASGTNGGDKTKATNQDYAFYVPAFVSFTGEDALQEATRHGLIVQTQLKTMATALILPDSLEAVANLTHINRIEVASKVQITLDTAKVPTRVREVHLGGVRYGQMPDQTSEAYKGEGVVVGVVDIGFDFTHPTFFDASDATLYRVKRVWDQRATASGTLGSPVGRNYGVEYATQDQILAAGHCKGNGSHGSHVAGIAGGSGAGTSFVGMAPKSDLVFVPTTMYSTAILDGVKYILDYAKSQQKPCVVNLSLGSHVGPHDGTSDFDRACDELKQEGFVLVGSAGNEGQKALYLQHTFTANGNDTAMMSYLDFSTTSTTLDIWSDNRDHFTATLRLTDGNGTPKSSISVSSDSRSNDYQYLKVGTDTLCKVYCWATLSPTNQKADVYFSIDAEKWNKTKYGDYKLNLRVVSNNRQKTMSAQMWLNNGVFTKGGFSDPLLKEGNTTHTVGETGGSGKSIISVGAYESRYFWKSLNGNTYRYTNDIIGNIAGFSSHGPTADGRMKPDIAAPGCVLISAYNSFEALSKNDTAMVGYAIEKNGKKYHFGAMQGTSMASPAAAGIIALWLQVNPRLSVDSVKHILENTALPHPDAGKPNAAYTWGYGKIDAAAGVQYLLKKKADLTGPTDPPGEDPVPLTLSTDTARQITDSSATLYMTHIGGEGTNFGFYYHTANNVKAGLSVQAAAGSNTKKLTADIKGLQAEKTYYYKAFGLQTKDNKIDTVWGETKSFQTLKKKVDTTPVNPPPVRTLAITTEEPKNITDSSATLYLSIDKGESDTLGFFYHTQSDVLNGKHVCAAFDMGSVYMAAVQDLESNRYYFVKAYGVENGDTVYGKLRMFQTLKKTEKPDSLAIEEALTVGRLLVYPNPVTKDGEFVVELPLEAGLGGAGSASGVGAVSGSGLNASASASGTAAYVLTITNLSGKTIQTLPMNQRQVVVRGLTSGVYLLQVESRKGGAEAQKVYRAKVVVQ